MSASSSAAQFSAVCPCEWTREVPKRRSPYSECGDGPNVTLGYPAPQVPSKTDCTQVRPRAVAHVAVVLGFWVEKRAPPPVHRTFPRVRWAFPSPGPPTSACAAHHIEREVLAATRRAHPSLRTLILSGVLRLVQRHRVGVDWQPKERRELSARGPPLALRIHRLRDQGHIGRRKAKVQRSAQSLKTGQHHVPVLAAAATAGAATGGNLVSGAGSSAALAETLEQVLSGSFATLKLG
mmetsp:Transcript_34135/g.89814  ORF Transcript_34135/g.89814 Transcript_34135/m.89814 type:complete len:237 (+) Transcript_34135:356-1066(+)